MHLQQRMVTKNYFFLFICLIITGWPGYSQIAYPGFTAAVHDPGNKDWEGCTFLFDELIDSVSRKDYRVLDQDLQGSRMVFKAGGIFEGYHDALCGIGGPRRIVTRGRYKVLNKDYICFAYYDGEVLKSAGATRDTAAAKDLGLFRIYRQGEQIRLLKSEGNQGQDQLNLLYSEMLALKSKERYFTLKNSSLNWHNENGASLNTVAGAITLLMQEEMFDEDHKILYELKADWGHLILLKVGNFYRYALWEKDAPGKNKVGKSRIALLKDFF